MLIILFTLFPLFPPHRLTIIHSRPQTADGGTLRLSVRRLVIVLGMSAIIYSTEYVSEHCTEYDQVDELFLFLFLFLIIIIVQEFNSCYQ